MKAPDHNDVNSSSNVRPRETKENKKKTVQTGGCGGAAVLIVP